MEWPPGSAAGSDADRLTLRDVCDIVYGLLLARVERQTLSLQVQFAVHKAAGAEMTEDWPSLDAAQERLDAVLNAEPTHVDSADRELLELMGVA